jgi:hypothetical protein
MCLLTICILPLEKVCSDPLTIFFQPLIITIPFSNCMSSAFYVSHVSELTWYLCFCAGWFHITVIFRPIYIVTNDSISFFFIDDATFSLPFTGWWTLWLFPFLGCVSSAAINLGVQVCLFNILISLLWIIYTVVRLLYHMGILYLIFWETSIWFFVMTELIYIPVSGVW